MRLPKLLVFLLISVATTGPVLAGVPEDPAANAPVVLRGSSAPLPSPPREVVVREVVYQPAYYQPPYDLPAYYWGLPFGALPFAIVRQHRHAARAPEAAQFHRR